MKIPVAKPYLLKEDAQAAYKTILSGWVTQGPRVEELEMKFAKFVGSKYAVAVSSCTTALHLAMVVNNIKKGDEVICPSFSFIATPNAIRYVQAIPIFVDIEEITYNLDPQEVEKKITKRTKAILLAHQMGMPGNLDKFRKICKKHKLILIEDAACALGSSYKNKRIGCHSKTVCFSFHPRKVITTGDGGIITTSNKPIYERLKKLRQHAMSIDDRKRHNSKTIIFEEYPELGYNYRMTDIQASIGIKQLEKLDWIVKERRKIAYQYNKAFKKFEVLKTPYEPDGFRSNYQSYTLYLQKYCPISRNNLMQKLLEKGISTRPGIMTSHRQKAYQQAKDLELPISERVCDQSLILPLWVPMSVKEVNYVIKNVIDLIK